MPSEETLILERDYAVQPEQLFAAWTRVEILQRWFGCATDMLWNVHVWDVRAGGAIHVSLDFDEKPFVVHGEFLEVDPPHRLAYRWNENERVEVEITPSAGGSHLRLMHTFGGGEEMRGILSTGWTAGLDQLGSI